MFAASTAIFLVLLTEIRAECRQLGVFVQCDTFKDAEDSQENKDEWLDLQIGNMSGTPNESYLFQTFPLKLFNNLRTLTVYNHVSDLKSQSGLRCTYNTDLQTITFYGNIIKRLKASSIPVVNELARLSLTDNNIESIESETFLFQSVEFIDLSRNKIKVIQKSSLRNLRTTTIWLKNNLITHIDPGSFPKTLQYLNLNGNQIRYIAAEVLRQLPDLRELSLNNNLLNAIPSINEVLNVAMFDFSHNEIDQIPEKTFVKHRNLTFLDLSHNRLETDAFLIELLANNNEELGVNLAFNRFTDLAVNEGHLEGKSVQLWLFGNTWNCKLWDRLRGKVEKYLNKCDLQFFTIGTVPYCLAWDEVFYTNVAEEGDDFQRAITNYLTKNKGRLPCKLTPNKGEFFNSPDWHCVA